MSTAALARVSAKTAREVAQGVPLGGPARKLLRPELTPQQFLDLLVEQKEFVDAVRFLARALPKAEAVWWACQCVRQAGGPNLPPKEEAAVVAAEKWVKDPSDANRRAAMPAAQAAEFGTAASTAALAAYWSGGSLAPPDAPPVPPDDQLTAQGAAGAVLLAAIKPDPQKGLEKCRQFLTLGLDVARGANRWK